jgi:hypothetical protein
VRLYVAAPLFTAAERDWNARLAAGLRAAGHDVFLPQEQEPGLDGPAIFATDVAGIDGAEGLVAIMDGPDPDSGTAWEVGYAYAARPGRRLQPDARGVGHEAHRPAERVDGRGPRGDPRRPGWDRRRPSLARSHDGRPTVGGAGGRAGQTAVRPRTLRLRLGWRSPDRPTR